MHRSLRLLTALLLVGCGPDPHSEMRETVGYRDGSDSGATSGERGTVAITEIGWAGSVRSDGTWDPADVFIELSNLSNRPINMSGWQLAITGAAKYTLVLPATTEQIPVGGYFTIAAKSDGCFPHADIVMPNLHFTTGEAFLITLRDADERLIEPAGDTSSAPFAGGYDLVSSYSMERIHLMFGQKGTSPNMWMFNNPIACPSGVTSASGPDNLSCHERIPNNDLVAPECRRHTYATPGRPNSPDYSGAYAAGGLD